jgi:hypothetical protein
MLIKRRAFEHTTEVLPPTRLQRGLLLALTTFQTEILDAVASITFCLFVVNMTGNVGLLDVPIAYLYRSDVSLNIVALIAFSRVLPSLESFIHSTKSQN